MAEEGQEVPVTPTESGDAAKAVQTGEQTPPTTAEAEKPADAERDTAQAPKKVDPRQKKISELAYRNRELERRVDRLLSLAERTAQPQQREEAPPKIENFATIDEYIDAKLAYREKQGQPREDRRAETVDPQQQRYEAALKLARDDLETTGSEKYEDFTEVVFDDSVKITPAMRDAIFEVDDLEKQADIAYFLAKNPKEVARISRLSPLRQASEVGKLEMKMSSAPPPKRTSAAPQPVTPVGGNATAPDSIREEMPFKDFLKVRARQLGRK